MGAAHSRSTSRDSPRGSSPPAERPARIARVIERVRACSGIARVLRWFGRFEALLEPALRAGATTTDRASWSDEPSHSSRASLPACGTRSASCCFRCSQIASCEVCGMRPFSGVLGNTTWEHRPPRSAFPRAANTRTGCKNRGNRADARPGTRAQPARLEGEVRTKAEPARRADARAAVGGGAPCGRRGEWPSCCRATLAAPAAAPRPRSRRQGARLRPRRPRRDDQDEDQETIQTINTKTTTKTTTT
jgi:hypothetical protein